MNILEDDFPVGSNDLAGLRCSDPVKYLHFTVEEMEGQTN